MGNFVKSFKLEVELFTCRRINIEAFLDCKRFSNVNISLSRLASLLQFQIGASMILNWKHHLLLYIINTYKNITHQLMHTNVSYLRNIMYRVCLCVKTSKYLSKYSSTAILLNKLTFQLGQILEQRDLKWEKRIWNIGFAWNSAKSLSC